MKTRCLIVDDEHLAIEIIASYLKNFEDVEIAGSCKNAVQAIEILNKENIDLMFLDIQMPHLKGTDLLRSLSRPPKVILTTAFREFALEGYELNVLDYLLKPISFERFVKAMDKYFESSQKKPKNNAAAPPQDTKMKDFIQVKSDRKTIRIQTDSIIYIECKKDFIEIVTNEGNILTHMPLYRIEEQLPHEQFLRIHRSYIVANNHIRAFNGEMIEIGERQLPIGRNYRKWVQDFPG